MIIVDRIQIIIALIIILTLIWIIFMIQKKRIGLKYSLTWIFLLILSLFLDIYPSTLSACSKLLGISLPSNMVFMVGIIFLTVVIFSLTVSVSRLSDKSTKLTQEIALLREEIQQIKKEP